MITSFIITSATVMAAFSNVSDVQSTSPYYYNAEWENAQIVRMDVLSENGKYLSNKLSHRFTYDDQGRLTEKSTQAWDGLKNEWREVEIYRYEYAGGNVVLTLLRQDGHTGNFMPVEKYNYTIVADHVVTVNKQKWDDKTNDMVSVEKILVMDSMKNMLAQGKNPLFLNPLAELKSPKY